MRAPAQDRFAEVKRCLARADEVFAAAAASEDVRERLRLMDEAEAWLVRAERAFARLTDRMTAADPRRGPLREARSFRDPPQDPALVWRRPRGQRES